MEEHGFHFVRGKKKENVVIKMEGTDGKTGEPLFSERIRGIQEVKKTHTGKNQYLENGIGEEMRQMKTFDESVCREELSNERYILL